MNRRFAFALALLTTSLPCGAFAQTTAVTLRPIDRATVRIVSLRGLEPSVGEGRRTRARRVVARAATTHGSGVAISPQLILTARHVVWAADAWTVIPPGSSTPIAARPVYVDIEHDLAIVAIDGHVSNYIALGAERALTISEPVSASGYPLDLREPTPGAASGEVSRVTRNGELHLNMTVNPGHSGGPVIDAQGRLVGILSARGRVDRGVEGLAVAVPIGPIREARSRVPAAAPTFRQYDRDLSAAIAWLASVGDHPLLDDRAEIEPVLLRAEQWGVDDADRDAIFASLAWNLLVEILEEANAQSVPDLPTAERTIGNRLNRTATRLARRAMANGPQVRRRFPIVRAISLGNVVVAESVRPDLSGR